MAEINWSSEARRDLKAIADFFESLSPQYSKYIVKRIFNTVSSLRDHPKIGRPSPEFEANIFRERIVEDFRILSQKTQHESRYVNMLNWIELLPHLLDLAILLLCHKYLQLPE